MRLPRGAHAIIPSGKQGNTNTHRGALICYSTQRTLSETLDRLAWEDARLTFKWDKRYISANQISTEFINIKIHPMSGLEICAVKIGRRLYDALH